MTTADEIRAYCETASSLSVAQNRQIEALRYAAGMLNEIQLFAKASSYDMDNPCSDIESIAEVALEGIKKRLTGEEK